MRAISLFDLNGYVAIRVMKNPLISGVGYFHAKSTRETARITSLQTLHHSRRRSSCLPDSLKSAREMGSLSICHSSTSERRTSMGCPVALCTCSFPRSSDCRRTALASSSGVHMAPETMALFGRTLTEVPSKPGDSSAESAVHVASTIPKNRFTLLCKEMI